MATPKTAPKSVTIKLTEEQRKMIQQTTGQDVNELTIEAEEKRESPLRVTAETARKAPSALEIPGVDKSSPKLYE
ncbi:MAG: hypothetical protein HYR58_05670 [Acidobacteria bacterium]|nr:hypothetical protein [Acidobacteriota bacterium]